MLTLEKMTTNVKGFVALYCSPLIFGDIDTWTVQFYSNTPHQGKDYDCGACALRVMGILAETGGDITIVSRLSPWNL